MHRALVIPLTLALGFRAMHAEGAADVSLRPAEEIVIYGQRPQPVPIAVFQDEAIQTEWVSAEEIQSLPARNAADVIEHLAGIRTQQRIQGQDAAVSIEGMPVEYTQILVDGQRFSGEIGGAGDLSDFSLQNVERIEVLRGGQGARFGTDAAGGVINLVTRDAPSDGTRIGAQGEAGTYDQALGGGTGAYRLGPLGLSLSGQYDQIDGFDAPDDPDVVLARPGGEDSRNRAHFLYGKWDAPVGRTLALRGNGLWRVEDDDVVTPETSEHSTRTDTNWRGNAGLDWQALEQTSLTGDLTWYAVETDSEVGREFLLFEDELSGDFSIDHDFETGPFLHALRAGIDIDFQRLDLDEGVLPPEIENPELESGRDIDESFLAPSVFVGTETEITDWLTLSLGLRGRFHSDFDPKALPQVALLVRPWESLALRASWGQNYRTPSLRDLYQPPTPQLGGAYFLAGNEDLEPESSMSVRAGFEWSPRTWLSLAGTGFYNDIDDYIRSEYDRDLVIGTTTRLVYPEDFNEAQVGICEAQALFYPDPADWTPECRAYFSGEPVEVTERVKSALFVKRNLDSVRTFGAESQLRVRLSDTLQLAADYTWLRTQVLDSNVTGDELPNEPEHAISLRAVLCAPGTATQLTTAFRWRGGVIPERSGTGSLGFADSNDRTDSSHQLDFRVAQPLQDVLGRRFDALGGTSIRLHVDLLNVTDERREDSYAIRGRSFVAGISGEFGSER